MKSGLKFSSFLILAIILIIFSFQVNAIFYDSYTYDFWGEPVPAPQAYVPYRVIEFDGIKGAGQMDTPLDLFVYNNEEIFIADSGNNRVIRSNKNWELINIYDNFENNGVEDSLNSPAGVFVDDRGHLYVADRDNERIVELTLAGDFVSQTTIPEGGITGVLEADFEFFPEKVVVDSAGRLYVIAQHVYDGIMQFDNQGTFTGFVGAPRVAPDMTDYFWRRLATQEQRSRMALILPTDYEGLAIDNDGFIYATVAGGAVDEDEAIRKLNPAGEDRLTRAGFFPPVGDILYPPAWSTAEIRGPSILTDVATLDYGIY